MDIAIFPYICMIYTNYKKTINTNKNYVCLARITIYKTWLNQVIPLECIWNIVQKNWSKKFMVGVLYRYYITLWEQLQGNARTKIEFGNRFSKLLRIFLKLKHSFHTGYATKRMRRQDNVYVTRRKGLKGLFFTIYNNLN